MTKDKELLNNKICKTAVMDDRRRSLIQGLNHLRNKALFFGTFFFALEKESTFKR